MNESEKKSGNKEERGEARGKESEKEAAGVGGGSESEEQASFLMMALLPPLQQKLCATLLLLVVLLLVTRVEHGASRDDAAEEANTFFCDQGTISTSDMRWLRVVICASRIGVYLYCFASCVQVQSSCQQLQ